MHNHFLAILSSGYFAVYSHLNMDSYSFFHFVIRHDFLAFGHFYRRSASIIWTTNVVISRLVALLITDEDSKHPMLSEWVTAVSIKYVIIAMGFWCVNTPEKEHVSNSLSERVCVGQQKTTHEITTTTVIITKKNWNNKNNKPIKVVSFSIHQPITVDT